MTRMEIEITGEPDENPEPLYERLARIEAKLAPSRWERLLMWLHLKKDHRLTKKTWRWP